MGDYHVDIVTLCGRQGMLEFVDFGDKYISVNVRFGTLNVDSQKKCDFV